MDIDQLQFKPLKIPRLIPKELIENVKDRSFTVEQFLMYQECQVNNPHNFLFAVTDENLKIRGYLWAESNLLDGALFVNTFSIDKEYWSKGHSIDKAIEFVDALSKQLQSPKVFWISTNEKFFKKKGFSRSKNVLMEYNRPKEL